MFDGALKVKIKALGLRLPGRKLHDTLKAISLYCQKHIQPKVNLEELTDLTWKRARGEGNEKLAQALKTYAEEEFQIIANLLAQRTADHQVRASRASADKLESEARLSETKELSARLDFVERCRCLGVLPIWNKSGHMTVIKAPELFNWNELAAYLLGAVDYGGMSLGETAETEDQSGAAPGASQ